MYPLRRSLFDKYILIVAILGFSSGFPIVFTGGTLSAILVDVGFDVSTIGLFSMVTLPYTLKFLWAPLLDKYSFPFVKGRRRGWILLSQALLIILINVLVYSVYNHGVLVIASIAVAIAFVSATQDIATDALRIEILTKSQQAMGATANMVGYRIAMIVGSSGSLIFSDIYGWQLAVLFTTSTLFFCFLVVMFIKEREREDSKPFGNSSLSDLFWFPLKNFITSYKHWHIILIFVILYKMPDAFSVALSTVFYKKLGYSNTEIGAIVKGVGLAATIFGSVLGGVLFAKIGTQRAIFFGIIVQAITNILFVWLNHQEHSLYALATVITVDNLAGGLGSAVFIALISLLCNKAFTASQYAMLSALASVSRTSLAATSGYIVEMVSWDWFFIATIFLAVPALIFCKRVVRSCN